LQERHRHTRAEAVPRSAGGGQRYKSCFLCVTLCTHSTEIAVPCRLHVYCLRMYVQHCKAFACTKDDDFLKVCTRRVFWRTERVYSRQQLGAGAKMSGIRLCMTHACACVRACVCIYVFVCVRVSVYIYIYIYIYIYERRCMHLFVTAVVRNRGCTMNGHAAYAQ
jgi:hypothetical protein